MSLAMYAAPFEKESIPKENILHKKRIKQEKNNKKRERFQDQKRKIDESMLTEIGKIHSSIDNGEDETEGLANFEPIPRPESLGVSKTAERDNLDEMNEENEDDVENFDNLDSSYAQQYYSQFLPGTIEGMQTEGIPDSANVNLNENLVEKINYMIHLLEENQDQKSEHVIEEMLLYLGLGVFVIYVLDSFVRIGKYTK
jgi:hypothetical protein